MAEETISCDEPAGTVESSPAEAGETVRAERGPQMPMARVGGKAPEFEGMAYVDGGFKRVKLSDSRGEWTVVCFYPGDFTFV